MYNSFYHSAEGSHWTKKNHKYIRKEGNRYIYPEDLKRLENTANSRRAAVNSQASPDYRAMSTANRQKMNRAEAANGSGRNDQLQARYTAAANTARSNRERKVRDAAGSNGVQVRNQEYAKGVSANRNARTFNTNSGTYNPSKNDLAAATARRKKQANAVNKQASANYITDSKRRAAMNSQNSSDYRGISKRTAAQNSQASPDYKSMSAANRHKMNRASAANGSGAKNQQYAKSANTRQAALRDRQAEVTELKRMDTLQNQGSKDYKKLSSQQANRTAAKSGKLVNPIATYRDKDGNVALRLHTKGAFASPTVADYKDYSREVSNENKRKKAAGSNGTKSRNQEYAKARSQERADQQTLDELKRSNATYAQNSSDYKGKSKRAAAKNSQASPDYKEISNANRQKMNRASAANGSGAKNQEYAKAANGQYENRKTASNGSGAKSQEYAKASTQAQNRKRAANGSADKGHYGGWVKDARSDQQYAKESAGYRKKKSINERLDRENTMKQKRQSDFYDNGGAVRTKSTKPVQEWAKYERSQRVKEASDRARDAYNKRAIKKAKEDKKIINRAKRAINKIRAKYNK